MDVDGAPVLKRKGAEPPELWLDDDGPGFPVSSRATKIRRLDADVPPVVPSGAVQPPPQLTQPVGGFGVEEVPMFGDVPVPVDMAAVAPAANEERAIVLYRPAEAERNLLLGPLRPGVPLRVSPGWINGLKETMLKEASNNRALFEGLVAGESSNLAMVPWAPSQFQPAAPAATFTAMMDAEGDSEGASMEVEQDGAGQPSTAGAGAQGEALHQWPPHCKVQQPPMPAPSYQPSPVAWSW